MVIVGSMRSVVILANPRTESLSHAIASTACAALERAGHEVVLHDLYAEGFTAAMSPAEHAAYHTDQPVLSPQVAQHVADLQACELLVFVYPTWWGGLPAILKGWLDRVMVPGVAFGFDEHHKVRPQLTQVRRIVGISTYGSKWWYVKVVNDNGRRTLLRTVRLSTGWGTRTSWFGLYRMDSADDVRRSAFLQRVNDAMAAL